jgi:hypothetical protein
VALGLVADSVPLGHGTLRMEHRLSVGEGVGRPFRSQPRDCPSSSIRTAPIALSVVLSIASAATEPAARVDVFAPPTTPEPLGPWVNVGTSLLGVAIMRHGLLHDPFVLSPTSRDSRLRRGSDRLLDCRDELIKRERLLQEPLCLEVDTSTFDKPSRIAGHE